MCISCIRSHTPKVLGVCYCSQNAGDTLCRGDFRGPAKGVLAVNSIKLNAFFTAKPILNPLNVVNVHTCTVWVALEDTAETRSSRTCSVLFT